MFHHRGRRAEPSRGLPLSASVAANLRDVFGLPPDAHEDEVLAEAGKLVTLWRGTNAAFVEGALIVSPELAGQLREALNLAKRAGQEDLLEEVRKLCAVERAFLITMHNEALVRVARVAAGLDEEGP